MLTTSKNKMFVYTAPECPNCDKLKAQYKIEGIKFEERNASRIKSPEDEIDREALVQASMQNMVLPVVVKG